MKDFIIVAVIALVISCTLGSTQNSSSFEPTGMRSFFISKNTVMETNVKSSPVGELKLVNIDGEDKIASKIGTEKGDKNARLNLFGRRLF